MDVGNECNNPFCKLNKILINIFIFPSEPNRRKMWITALRFAEDFLFTTRPDIDLNHFDQNNF